MGQCALCYGGRNNTKKTLELIESRNEDHDDDRQQPAPLNTTTSDNSSSVTERNVELESTPSGSTASRANPDPIPARRMAKMFNYNELKVATYNFHKNLIIEQDSVATVFKGEFKDTGELIAVKRLNPSGSQGENEWIHQVLMLHRLHHPNLINLIGCCTERDLRFLIYEFMPFGSLKQLLGPTRGPLGWDVRMIIADGVAKALDYLHNEADPPVIYKDLKPDNILLAEGFIPKVSDFGIAMYVREDDQDNSKIVSGSMMGRRRAYCAPELRNGIGEVTIKSDVYSFGVILLELITGLKEMDVNREKHHLAEWMHYKLANNRDYLSVSDRRLNGRFPEDIFRDVIKMGLKCTEDDPEARPSMSDVAHAMDCFKYGQCHEIIIRVVESGEAGSSGVNNAGRDVAGFIAGQIRVAPLAKGSEESVLNGKRRERKRPYSA